MQLRAGAVAVGLRAAPRGRGRAETIAIQAAVIVAWIALIVTVTVSTSATRDGAAMPSMPGMAGMAEMPGMAAMPGMPGMTAHRAPHNSALLGSGAAAAIAMWTLMVVAMMLPAAIPAVRHVAANSLRRRRRRAIAAFVCVYALIWIAFGGLVLLASPLWASLHGETVLAVALATAAGWQLTAHKRRALLDCHRPSPLPPQGWRATAGVVRFAARNGLACLRSCWAMMLAMGVASSMMLLWMVAVTGIVTTEKLAERPRRAARVGAVVLAAGAVLAALL
jgi:predicted metal-binding membrane protein